MEQLVEAITGTDMTAMGFAGAFVALDVLTGIAKGAATHSLSSPIMRNGFWHKLAIFAALTAALLCDLMLTVGLNIGIGEPIFVAACTYVCVMELLSILENIKEINPELGGSRLMELFGRRPGDDGDEGAED